ncbi:MAG: hypothetical protein IT305_24490 [Chloroflexi bacterium]|nr:hypothetical protein [Chloroflexota bacterium]
MAPGIIGCLRGQSSKAWHVLLVVGLVATLLPAGRVAAQVPHLGDIHSWEIIPCPVTLPLKDEVEGRTYDCGIVVVPENYEKPAGRTIELA